MPWSAGMGSANPRSAPGNYGQVTVGAASSWNGAMARVVRMSRVQRRGDRTRYRGLVSVGGPGGGGVEHEASHDFSGFRCRAASPKPQRGHGGLGWGVPGGGGGFEGNRTEIPKLIPRTR